MIENLLSNALGDTSELFHFYHDKGIEGNTWKSIHEGTPLHATKLSGNINTLPGPSGGVVFNHSASDRLIFNRPVPEFVYSFVSTVEPRRIASGRIGAVIGNYQSNPKRNIEIYTNNEIRIYGAPTVPICNTKVTTRSTFGYTVDEIRKEIRVFKDGIVRGVYEGTLTIVQEDGRKWIKPNGDGILRFPEPLLVNDDLTILAVVKPPTNPSGTTYSISDAITASYVSGTVDDIALGFGGNGTSLYYEKDGLSNSLYLNDFSLLNSPKRAMTIYTYMPRAIGYSKEIILSNSQTGKVKHLGTQRKIFRSRLEGILGGDRGGRYGREGLIRSVLILKGEIDEPRLDAIAEFMGQV